jgi:hypothetical protein
MPHHVAYGVLLPTASGKAKVEISAREGRSRVSLLKMDMVKSVPGNSFIPEINFQRVRAAI